MTFPTENSAPPEAEALPGEHGGPGDSSSEAGTSISGDLDKRDVHYPIVSEDAKARWMSITYEGIVIHSVCVVGAAWNVIR